MTALVTIFMHVVCNPLEWTANNDIALMEVIIGFFGRLEFVTSGVAAFTKTGEFVRQARYMVDRARANAQISSGTSVDRNRASVDELN